MRIAEGRKALKEKTPRTLGPEIGFRGFWEEKAVKRVDKNPENGTYRARQPLVEWTPESGKR